DAQEINQIEIFDYSGKCLKKYDMTGQHNTFNLNIENLHAGIYLLIASVISQQSIKRYYHRLIKINEH
ncbi:MAG TPA: T9SS type A sorting domain-containing protein, partial [Prolixibacteraceae bacterium]|nr:T9SS type A sorting domain-containing protein [Prolixibacteraceae bacterium]